MFALMTLWYGAFADVPLHGGYFYLCPPCYETCIVPHLAAGHGSPGDDTAGDTDTAGADDTATPDTAQRMRPDPTEPGPAA